MRTHQLLKRTVSPNSSKKWNPKKRTKKLRRLTKSTNKKHQIRAETRSIMTTWKKGKSKAGLIEA